MSIGERISDLRKEQGLSQGQLADAMEVSRQAVSKWENDQSSPDTLKLIRLAEVLNTEVEFLATGRKPVCEEPPMVINVKKVDQIYEKVVEKPVVRKVVRIRYRRNPWEIAGAGLIGFALGLVVGILLL